jgi:Concanavalin A-like lectin/glucanases superfamily
MNARIAISAAFATGVLAISAGSASASLVGEWNFDSDQGTTISDSSGYGNNGTLYGAATLMPGFTGDALSVDGQPGGVDVPDSPSLEPASTVTVAAWVENDGSPGRFRYIVAKGWSNCISGSYALYTGPSGGLQFYVGRARGASYVRSQSISNSIWDGAWHLAVGTFDGSVVRLYIDGVEVGSGSAAPGTLAYSLAGSNDLFVGDYPGCQRHTFTGEIDDVQIWNTALSPGQVAALMTPPSSDTEGSGTSVAGGSKSGPSPVATSNGLAVGNRKNDVTLLAPRISKLAVSMNAGRHNRVSKAHGRDTRSTITYTDTEPAQSTLTVERATVGISRGARCIGVPSPRVRLRHDGRSCTRWVHLISFRHVDAIGENTIRSPLLTGRALTAGRYRIVVQPALGQLKGLSVTIGFLVRS